MRLKQIAGVLIVVAVLGVIGFQMHRETRAETPPTFSFDREKAAGWWARDPINVQAVARSANYTGEEPIERLPVADITLFEGQPQAEGVVDGCFVSFSYYDYALDDVAAAYDNYFGDKVEHGTLDTFDPISRIIMTFEGEKEYELRQYRFVLEGQDNLEGYQVGFIPLEEGYVRTEGICKTYEELAKIVPIMDSVELIER